MESRHQWQCECRYQFSVTSGTVFHQTYIDLPCWLMAVWLVCHSPKGVSSKQIQRELRCTYKTAWCMTRRIRLAIQKNLVGVRVSGRVELDEAVVKADGGMATGNVPHHTRDVLGMASRTDGTLRMFVLGQLSRLSRYGSKLACHETGRNGGGPCARMSFVARFPSGMTIVAAWVSTGDIVVASDGLGIGCGGARGTQRAIKSCALNEHTCVACTGDTAQAKYILACLDPAATGLSTVNAFEEWHAQGMVCDKPYTAIRDRLSAGYSAMLAELSLQSRDAGEELLKWPQFLLVGVTDDGLAYHVYDARVAGQRLEENCYGECLGLGISKTGLITLGLQFDDKNQYEGAFWESPSATIEHRLADYIRAIKRMSGKRYRVNRKILARRLSDKLEPHWV